jgi:tetratricopeptide (TPR) repeat protein
VVLAVVLILMIIYRISTRISEPVIPEEEKTVMTRTTIGDSLLTCGHGWLKRAGGGWWQMVLEGSPYEIGFAHGLLTRELMAEQEKAFTDRLAGLIPSRFYQRFMLGFVRYFNRNLDQYAQPEYCEEIFGISRSAPAEYDFIGPAYARMLNYHAAHDLGHAVQNMNLVACSAFGAWGARTSDSSLLIGRNFDFYINDEFAENKILCFIKPDSGYRFVSITWAGFAGVVSGMNEKGLTVTLNAAKSGIPFGARTPVSLLAREILQYAANIEEAMQIAESRETFVAESFLIGSASDGKVIVIEKSPEKTAKYDPGKDFVLLTNHFQSDAFKDDELNLENIANETSVYRLQRLQELVDARPGMTVAGAADILRDYRGLGGRDIGLGNEKAVNQFIAHHSVIFRPDSLQVWIASPPWQLGEYRGYRLDSIFTPIGVVPADTMLSGNIYQNLVKYRALVEQIESRSSIDFATDSLITLNKNFFHTYRILGDYFESMDQPDEAAEHYRRALETEAPSKAEREAMMDKMK